MSSREHAKGAVCGSRIIEVYPQRDHPHERLGWSMRVNYPLLHGPRPPSRFFASLAQRQSCILMPRNEPVRFFDLSNSVARNGTASPPKMSCAIPTSLDPFASAVTLGSFSACRTPARLRCKEACENSALKSTISFAGIKSATIAKPRSSTVSCSIVILRLTTLLLLDPNLRWLRGKMVGAVVAPENWQESCRGCRVAHAALFLWPGATREEARFLIANLELEIDVSLTKQRTESSSNRK